MHSFHNTINESYLNRQERNMLRIQTEVDALKQKFRERGIAKGYLADDSVITGAAVRVYQCAVCRDQCMVLDANNHLKPCSNCDGGQNLAQAKMRQYDRYSSRFGRSVGQTFANYNPQPDGHKNVTLEWALAAAQHFAKTLSGWLVLYGECGTGKSHLAAAVRNAAGVPTLFITAPDLFQSLMALFNKTNEEEEAETYDQRLWAYKSVPLLILDDLGVEKGTEWTDATLFALLDHRYRNELPTMICTNLNLDDRNTLEFRIYDRVTDKKLVSMAMLAGSSYRQIEEAA